MENMTLGGWKKNTCYGKTQFSFSRKSLQFKVAVPTDNHVFIECGANMIYSFPQIKPPSPLAFELFSVIRRGNIEEFLGTSKVFIISNI